MASSNLFGIWRLKGLSDVGTNGERSRRDYEIRGRLLYAEPAAVFVGLSYFRPTGYSSNFYSGDFEVDFEKGEIRHKVIVSSDENRLGETLKRSFFLKGESLVLVGKNHLGNEVELTWQRE